MKKHGPTYGLHGMLLFGNSEEIFASHLAMFHAPHDYQLVLKIHLADRKLEKELKQQLNRNLDLWTLEPQQFELARLAPDAQPALREFRATIFHGHFEQGGKIQYKNVLIKVEATLLFRHLSAQHIQHERIVYLPIGEGRHRFLLKQIDSRPDFDHLLAIDVKAEAQFKPLLINKHGEQEPAQSKLEHAIQRQLGLGTEVRGSIYYDHADLQ
ncbi:MAG: hypothetical protein KGM99_03650 [Burkholderiales bacterium]|nr:hypothetical protein [Burkholderiales bacterium]